MSGDDKNNLRLQLRRDAFDVLFNSKVFQGAEMTPPENLTAEEQRLSAENRVYGNKDNLTSDQKKRMDHWGKYVRLDADLVSQLQEKYGEYSYNLMMRAMMEPLYLMKDVGKDNPRVSSKKALEYLLATHLSEEQMKQALSGKYGRSFTPSGRTETPALSAQEGQREERKAEPPRTQTSPRVSTPVSSARDEFVDKRITIGDSRTVGMACAHGVPYNHAVNAADANGNKWFAKEGQGLTWLKRNIGTIKQKANDCQQVVINLGVNDIGRNPDKAAKEYVAYINQLASEWKAQGKEVVFTSVNPVDDRKCAVPSNADIEKFNQLLKEGLSSDVSFVDTYSELKGNSKYKLSASDGLHCPTVRDYAYVSAIVDARIAAYAREGASDLSNTGLAVARVVRQSHVR